MANGVINYRFRTRRANAATWTSLNDILLDGEIGYEKDTGRYKIGDGATGWNALEYSGAGRADLNGLQDGDVLIWNDSQGIWEPGQAGGGDVEEAPTDGKLYGRKDESWAEITSGGSGGDVDLSEVTSKLDQLLECMGCDDEIKGFQRPKDWLPLENPSSDEMRILVHIRPNQSNYIQIRFSKVSAESLMVDYGLGDGWEAVQQFSNAVAYFEKDYDFDDPALDDTETSEGFKQVIAKMKMVNTNQDTITFRNIYFNYRNGSASSFHPAMPIVDMRIRLEGNGYWYGSDGRNHLARLKYLWLDLHGSARADGINNLSECEEVAGSWERKGATEPFTNMFRYMPKLKKVDGWGVSFGTSASSMTINCLEFMKKIPPLKIAPVNLDGLAPSPTFPALRSASGTFDIDLSGRSMDMNNISGFYSIEKLIIRNCNFTTDNISTLNEHLHTIIFDDCTFTTTASSWGTNLQLKRIEGYYHDGTHISGTKSISRMNIEWLDIRNANVSLNIPDNLLDKVALEHIFTYLPDLTGTTAKTITIRGNPGASLCDTSIATNKNWIVTN